MTGVAIDTAHALSKYNKKEFHHIFPTAYLKRLNAPGQHNCLANICMLPAAENGAISDSDPHEYLPQCAVALGSHAEPVFASNLIPAPSAFSFSTATLEEFTHARSTLISDLVRRLCDGERP